MNPLKSKTMLLSLIVLWISLIAAPDSMGAINAEVRANDEGLYVKYDLGILGGSNEINLTPGAPMAEIFSIKKLITVEAAVREITTEPNAVKLSTKFSGSIFKNGPIELPVTIPFGEFGIYVSFIERQFIPLADHDIEASVLFSKRRTQYAVNLNLDSLFEGRWDGEATPDNSSIHETVVNPVDNSTMAEINLVFNSSKYFTIVNYNIVLAPQGNALSAPGEPEQNPQDITGKILIPNGAYHIWANPDLSTITSLPE